MGGIPFVRHVEPTDDGCAVYQCLMCKSQWESRTAPFYKWEGLPHWNFCPYCGCSWTGIKEWDEKKKWDEKRGKYNLAVSERARKDRVRPLKFTIQKKYIGGKLTDGYESHWEFDRRNCPDAHQAVDYLKAERAREEEDSDDPDFGHHIYRAIPDGEFIKWKEIPHE